MNLQLTPTQRRIELARPWVLLSLYIGLALAGWWWLAVPLAVVLWQGPWHPLMLRCEALRIAPNTKQIQLLETALALLASLAGLYWLTGLVVGLVYGG